jgi:hypothetical protein
METVFLERNVFQFSFSLPVFRIPFRINSNKHGIDENRMDKEEYIPKQIILLNFVSFRFRAT